MLPNTFADGAVLIATQIRKKVNGLNIPHVYSSVAYHVTLSMGVATRIPIPGQPASDLIHCADELLYAAKGNGRNQIRSELEEMIRPAIK